MKTKTSTTIKQCLNGSPSSSAGFTLIELVVVLSLIMVALWWAWPDTGLFSRTTLTAEAEQVITALKKTRAQAEQLNRAQRFVFHLDSGQYGVGAKRQLDETIAVTVTAADQETEPPHLAAIRFYPDGSNTGGLIELTANAQSIHIHVDWLTGRITRTETRK